MVYNDKFVVAIKNNGKILREKGDKVFIPYGSEYSILMKNLNTVKAVVTVLVDGKNIAPGSRFVLDAGESLELEGFIKHNKVTNKFKFIERTKKIEKHRGIRLCDGLVQVTFQFEKQSYKFIKNDIFPNEPYWNALPKYHYTTCCSTSLKTKASGTVYSTTCRATKDFNDVGITVKGSNSDQSFDYGSVGSLESQQHNIVLQLKGKLRRKRLKKAILTKTKLGCETCGKKNKSTYKFCVECGTALF